MVETLFATNVRKRVVSLWRYRSTTVLSVQKIYFARSSCNSLLSTPSILTAKVAAHNSIRGMVGGLRGATLDHESKTFVSRCALKDS